MSCAIGRTTAGGLTAARLERTIHFHSLTPRLAKGACGNTFVTMLNRESHGTYPALARQAVTHIISVSFYLSSKTHQTARRLKELGRGYRVKTVPAINYHIKGLIAATSPIE